jgi:hypothetical protein
MNFFVAKMGALPKLSEINLNSLQKFALFTGGAINRETIQLQMSWSRWSKTLAGEICRATKFGKNLLMVLTKKKFVI